MVSTTTLSEQAVRERIQRAKERYDADTYDREDLKIIDLLADYVRYLGQKDWYVNKDDDLLDDAKLLQATLPYFRPPPEVVTLQNYAKHEKIENE